ncbi:MAG: hypothetical protein FJZ96_04725 [Chloroflexi bacterium]|nr:hypothetical protein [Chloroflexota bacterium]
MRKKVLVSSIITILFLVLLAAGLGNMNTQAAKYEIPEGDGISIYTPDKAAVLILSNQTEEVSDTYIELNDVRLGKSAITGIVCYPLPSDADWLIEGITLAVGEQEYTDYNIAMKERRFSEEGEKDQRCDYLVIPLDSRISSPTIIISINALAITVPEQPDCEKVQERLDAAQTGIVIKCENGSGYFDFDILQMPESMLEIEVVETIRDALHDEIIKGPWVFEIQITH